MSTKLRILFAITAAPLLAAPTCDRSADGSGDPQVCQEAVDYLDSECGIAADDVESCSKRDTCVARCILDASCEAFSGGESASAKSYQACAAACDDEGDGGSGSSPGCHPCAAFLEGEATYDEICESGQQLLEEWSTCICQGTCEAACFEHCQGFDPDPMCSDCISTSCAAQTEACQIDD